MSVSRVLPHSIDAEASVLGGIMLRNDTLAQLDDLEAIAQRPRDRVELVRGRDEQDLRQIERDLEVVVRERAVLLGVEDLEERAQASSGRMTTRR